MRVINTRKRMSMREKRRIPQKKIKIHLLQQKERENEKEHKNHRQKRQANRKSSRYLIKQAKQFFVDCNGMTLGVAQVVSHVCTNDVMSLGTEHKDRN
mmetsp:Transcript_15521/g.23673  ORF Transcript_15521/g.23673 Transcript_15521/m.23673 type:complete len:98 (-) Transcript_15521:25-318(-)